MILQHTNYCSANKLNEKSELLAKFW